MGALLKPKPEHNVDDLFHLQRVQSRVESSWLRLLIRCLRSRYSVQNYLEETPGQTHNTLEGLYIPRGLGMPQDPPGRAGGRRYQQGHLGYHL